MSFTAFQYTPVSLAMLATDTSTLVNLEAIYEWYVENGDTRTLANLQVLQSKLNHPRQ